jgi:chorismate synthase
MELTIRRLDGYREYAACEQLQFAVWKTAAVPHDLLVTFARNGGIVLGAFNGAQLIGTVFGFLGTTATGRLKLNSHRAAVLAEFRNSGIGEQLKWTQRAVALADGLDVISWTFDPLLGRNARLNLHKLGGTARRMIENAYGAYPIVNGVALPSDRLVVEWELTSPRVMQRAAGVRAALDWLHEPELQTSAAVDSAVQRLRLPIPADLDQLTAQDFAAAYDWRMRSRPLLAAACAAGWIVSDSARSDGGAWLLLERQVHGLEPQRAP